jgi:protein SCO1/2
MSNFSVSRKIAAVLALFAVGLAGCGPYQFKGAVLEPPSEISDFTLPTVDGGTFRLSDYSDRIVLVYFGYTYCPDVCPTTLSQLKLVMEQLGDRADQVQVVMISVDPERDMPDQFDRYLANFNESFIGLRTTDTGLLDPILEDFGAFYILEPTDSASETGYLVSHTASLFLVDGSAGLREVFPYGTPAEDIASDIRHILREK